MNCPKCKDIDLIKKDYNAQYVCEVCGGLWLEFDNLPGFFERLSTEENDELKENINDERTGLCPSGHGIMIRAKIEDISEPFFLEKCSSCGGIWFDNDEWQRILMNNLAENLNEIWCSAWQSKQRKHKSRISYLESNKKLLGENVFEKILQLSALLKTHPEKGRAIALLQHEII